MPDEAPAPAPNGEKPPVAPPAPASAPVSMSSDQLKVRLDETRSSAEKAKEQEMLKTLGFKSMDEAKAARAKAKEAEDAQLSENERYKKQVEELKPKAERGERYETLAKSIVDASFAKLPEAARTAIDAIAKGDPEQRFQLMKLAEAIQPAGTPAPPAATPPVNNAPPAAPPPTGQPTKFQEFEAMRAKSPVLGDLFYQSNMREIEATRPPAT